MYRWKQKINYYNRRYSNLILIRTNNLNYNHNCNNNNNSIITHKLNINNSSISITHYKYLYIIQTIERTLSIKEIKQTTKITVTLHIHIIKVHLYINK